MLSELAHHQRKFVLSDPVLVMVVFTGLHLMQPTVKVGSALAVSKWKFLMTVECLPLTAAAAITLWDRANSP